MIDLQALKEQLKLLGHDLPDEQVVAILKEMNIDFAGDPSGPTDSLRGPEKASGAFDEDALFPGPPRTGSILDNFHGRPPLLPQQQHGTASAAAVASPQTAVVEGFTYGYTSHAHSAAAGLDYGKPLSGMMPRPGPAAGHTHGTGRSSGHQAAGSENSDDCYDYDSEDEVDAAEEPGASGRYCVAEAGTTGTSRNACGHLGVHEARMERPAASDLAGGRGSGGVGMRGLAPPDRDLADRLRRVSLNEPTTSASAGRQPRFEASAKGAEAARRPSLAAGAPRPAGATAARDQHYKAHGQRHSVPADWDTRAMPPPGLDEEVGEEDEGDVVLSDPDKDPLHLGGSLQDLRWPTQPEGPGRAAQDPYTAWLGGRGDPLATHLADALLAQGQLSPQASNRSIASRATSRYSTASKRAGGPKKVDRVQRYQQLQQEWSQNRFLKQANGASRGTSRKPVNFHSHFASLHAAEEAERQRMLRETRAKTKKELGAATEAPTANRRDELRWQTRMRLKNQS